MELAASLVLRAAATCIIMLDFSFRPSHTSPNFPVVFVFAIRILFQPQILSFDRIFDTDTRQMY